MYSIIKHSGTDFSTLLDGVECSRYPRIGICMDAELSILYKIGDYQMIEEVYNQTVEAFKQTFGESRASDVVLLDISTLTQEEINRCMDICDYCGIIYQKFLNTALGL